MEAILEDMTVVIAGGTTQARQLAQKLVAEGLDVWTTLAGATVAAQKLPGKMRVGGFGSDQAMQQWLNQIGAKILIDATHPFAARMSARISKLADAGYLCVRLERPGWEKHPNATDWIWVSNHQTACQKILELAQEMSQRPQPEAANTWLTVGRQELHQYCCLNEAQIPVWARMITPPDPEFLGHTVLERGPFSLSQEIDFCSQHQIRILVSKNSGGDDQKLQAAKLANITVVMVQRPFSLDNMPKFATVEQTCDWVLETVANLT